MGSTSSREPQSGWLHHSDRGSQYASGAHQARLSELGGVASMSRRGNCWDNAPVESFFGTLKTERLNRRSLQSLEQVKNAVSTYIHGFYNPKRIHSHNQGLSPDHAERNHQALHQRLAS